MWHWRWTVVVLAAGAAVACTSPEASRSRGSGAGADVGNRPRREVRIHDGARMYYGTPTHGDGIGQRAFIGDAAQTAGR